MPEQLFSCPACGNPCAQDVVDCRVCGCQVKKRKDRAQETKKFRIAMAFALIVMLLSVYFTFLRPRRSPVSEYGSLPNAESARSPLPVGQSTPQPNRPRKKR